MFGGSIDPTGFATPTDHMWRYVGERDGSCGNCVRWSESSVSMARLRGAYITCANVETSAVKRSGSTRCGKCPAPLHVSMRA